MKKFHFYNNAIFLRAWPVKHGRVFMVPLKKCPVYATVHVYTGQVAFSQGTRKTLSCFTGHPADKNISETHTFLYRGWSRKSSHLPWRGLRPTSPGGSGTCIQGYAMKIE